MKAAVTHEQEDGKHVFRWHPEMSPRQIAYLLQAAVTQHLNGGDMWVKEVDFHPADCKLVVDSVSMPRSSNCKVDVVKRRADLPKHEEPRNFVRYAQIGHGSWVVIKAGPDTN